MIALIARRAKVKKTITNTMIEEWKRTFENYDMKAIPLLEPMGFPSKDEWEKNSVVIYDEAAQTAHARRTQSGDAVELDNLIGISGQRNQLLIFICHHSRKLDPNVVREVNRIIWKRPTYAYQLFERDELIDFTMKAFDYFAALRKGRTMNERTKVMLKRANLVLDFDDFKFLQFENKLPHYWCDELSNLFEDIQKVGRKSPGY